MLKSLFWMNKGNNSYIYYLVNGLIYSAVMFTMMLVIGSFSQLFPGHFQVIIFIIFIYVFLLGTSYLYDNTFDMAIFQPVGIIYEHNNYDGILAKSFIYHPICNLCVTAIIYAIQYAIMRYKEKN